MGGVRAGQAGRGQRGGRQWPGRPGRRRGRGAGRGAGAGTGPQSSKDRKADGSPLVLRNLASGQERRIELVTNYEFAKDGSKLIYTTSTKDGSNDGAFALDTGSGQVTALASGKGDYKGIAIDEGGKQVAFLTNRDDYAAEQPAFSLFYWDGKAAAAKAVAAPTTPGMPQGWSASEYREPNFSHNGLRLFLGTAPKPEPEVKDTTPDDEKVVVDVWAWTDPLLQPMQLKQVDQERRRNYQAMVSLKDGRLLQLASTGMPDLQLADRGDIDVALGRNSLPYQKEISWDQTYSDVYLVNLRTGDHEKLLEHLGSNAALSPSGKYLAWWDEDHENWNVMDVATHKVSNVSKAIPFPMQQEEHDTPDQPPAYGSAGWTDNDAQFLIYDRDDIWSVDPTGKTEPKNITGGVGRRENLRLRYVRLDPEEQTIKPNQELLLSAFNYQTKDAGFYRDRLGAGAPPSKLVMMPKSFGGGFGGGVRKADNANVLLYNRGSFEEFPDLYVSGPDFSDQKRMSDANPQQKDYVWGTSELVEWRSGQDGEMLQGVLLQAGELRCLEEVAR